MQIDLVLARILQNTNKKRIMRYNIKIQAIKFFAAALPMFAAHFVSAQPLPPEISYISVDHQTGELVVNYYQSPSASASEIGIKLITRLEPTVNAQTLRWIPGNTDGEARFPLNSPPLSDADTIRIAADARDALGFESAALKSYHSLPQPSSSFDYCQRQAAINWQPYRAEASSPISYTVYKQKPGGAAASIDVKHPTELQHQEPVNQTDAGSCFYIATEITDSRGAINTAYSAKTCPQVAFPKLPKFMNADYASVKAKDSIELSFTIDTDTDIKLYKLWHSTSKDGPFAEIDSARLGETEHPFVFYATAEGIEKERNFFKLVAYDICGDSLLSSNLASNIVLELRQSHASNDLTWNQYYKWQGRPGPYQVQRSLDNEPYQQAASNRQHCRKAEVLLLYRA
jgi:hypothetical protein